MTDEQRARAGGWYPLNEAHVMFRNCAAGQICRRFQNGESYDAENDSYMSVPLKHAGSWAEACERDGL